MAGMMDGIWQLADALSGKSGGGVTRSQATVSRIDNEGVVWVHLPGGVDETPVNGRTLAGVRPGDSVQVEVAGGRASIVGNATAPSVGQREVTETVAPVAESVERATVKAVEASDTAKTAEEVARAAKSVADATGQHFWHADDGAHVTQVTQDEWSDAEGESYHSGPNSLWNSLGMLFRDGLNNLLALVTGSSPGVAIYDGQGNVASNIVAQFTGNEVSLGRNSSASTIDMCGGVFTFEVDNSNTSRPMATIRVNSNSDDVTSIPVLRLTAGSGSNEYGFDIAGVGTAQYPISVVTGSGHAVNMGGLGVQTMGIDLAGIGGGGTFSAYDGLYMVTNTGTNFWSTVPGTILWSSGGWAMSANQTAILAHNVSTCPTGIVLHWQPYTSSTVRNYYHYYHFIPKTQVASFAGTSLNVTLTTGKFANVATKTLYVSDDRITGHADNVATGTASGITYANNAWVLTQVIAV